MSTIGQRLREERERLGLNQTDFAEIGGIQKRAQINYEKDERHPDAAYLAAITEAGVDVLYVLVGQRQVGVTSPPAQEQEVPLTPEERALLENFRHCSPDTRAAIKATSDALAQRRKKKTG
ncbi:TPA: helix-turn-helix domain-containing protein [Pseudomonas aeruginosa]